MSRDQLPGGGLTLTPHQRMHLANRVMLQGPKNLSEAQLAEWRRDLEKKFDGIPGDVLFTLDAIRLLAEQGNTYAVWLFDYESERLGFTRKSTFAAGGRL